MIEAKRVRELLNEIKKFDQDRLEKTSVEIRRTEHSSLAGVLVSMVRELFKRCSLESCFTGDKIAAERLVVQFMVMREDLVKEKIKCIKFEAAKDILVKACLTGDMDTINAALVVLGHKPPPDETTTH